MNASNAYDARPWLGRYRDTGSSALLPEYTDALAMFRATVERAADRPALVYFDGSLSYAEVDAQSDALASALLANGFTAGDRLGLYLQNTPHFVIAEIAAWKAGGIAVPINPMNRARELTAILEDSGAKALVLHRYLYRDIAADVLPALGNVMAVVTDERDFQTRNDARVLPAAAVETLAGAHEFSEFVRAHRGQKPPPVRYEAGDTALLVYTSGTTGAPKGAMNTHGNVTFIAQAYRDWIGVRDGAPIYGVAPLFHITGLEGHIALAILTGSPLILHYRFDPAVALEAIREHRAEFTIGSITVFIALMNAPNATREDLATLEKIYSGGAPIPPSVVEQFTAKFGHTIHNAYGLTETTSPATFQPLGAKAPVDEASGSLSIGVPIYDTSIYIVGDDGKPVAPGEVGEIAVRGPQVVAGYWGKAEETARSFPDRRLLTGDVGFMDADGWFYLVDRKKDMINCAGYKVWPREVEDVLYTHPAVREAAVIGVPDTYRGESVKAVISFKPGQSAAPDAIIEFCKERMAAYKYPRTVEVVDELPKTVTGKILRRELREAAKTAPAATG